MKNIAIILAGGIGRRVGDGKPKQFMLLGGRTIVEYSVKAFQRNSNIDEIAIVMHRDYIAEMKHIASLCEWTKLTQILPGGSERNMSTLSAIEFYGGIGECNLIFHDAARPLVSERIIDDVVTALESYEAVGVAVPVTDTIFELDKEGCVVRIPDRNMLRRAQTPQAFRLSLIKEAYKRALRDPDFSSTDDCGVVLQYMPEVRVHTVIGDEQNIKLTYKEDLDVMKRRLYNEK